MSFLHLAACFGRKIDGDSWFTWRFSHLPGPSIFPKRTPMAVLPLKHPARESGWRETIVFFF